MSEHSNAIADQYRHRIFWIEERLQEMASQTNGKVLRSDAEAMIYGRYSCSPDAVRRYLRTLQGKGFLEVNDTHIIIAGLRKEGKK